MNVLLSLLLVYEVAQVLTAENRQPPDRQTDHKPQQIGTQDISAEIGSQDTQNQGPGKL